MSPVEQWFKSKGWKPFAYQEEAWKAYREGRSGLISVPTGYGKTLAATLAPIEEAMSERCEGLFLLYISPLRALTRDLSQSLQTVIEQMGANFKVECRTGDTKTSTRAKQLLKMPPILFTTPESLSIMLSYADSSRFLSHLKAVVVDEWHELIASKRGIQTQLGVERLRKWNPALRVWGLSATLGNLEEAAEALVGAGRPFELIRAHLPKEIELDPVVPETLDTFPWAGHLGLRLLPDLCRKLSRKKSTLIFTNTRSQCERWHEALMEAMPAFQDKIAIHHSAIASEDREEIEEGLRTGKIKWVVCTSSLDLGVDFQRVEQVVQIGSAKSLARLVQRAGRSMHRPGEASHLLYVPTNSWELVELEAAREALAEGVVEPRRPLHKPFDVLAQHLVTLACGDGFRDEDFHEIKSCYSFRDLTQAEWNWTLEFVHSGGPSLQAYPQYKKIYADEEGTFRIRNSLMARQQRMAIGTIPRSDQMNLMLKSRKRIGSIEESFISKLKRGDVFYFAGRKLEFLFAKDMSAYVQATTRASASTPSWAGNQLPLSESLSGFFQRQLARPPTEDLAVLFAAQERISRIPRADELMLEVWDSREGRHLFIYPFGGRAVHEGLAAVWTHRLGTRLRASFLFSVNDYGVMIQGPKNYPFQDLMDDSFFTPEGLEPHISAALNLTEMSMRRFRNIAQTAGLVFTGYPGSRKTGKQMQVSTSLLFEVFRKYDPNSLLFHQARREVLDQQLEIGRLHRKLEKLQSAKRLWVQTKQPSPLAVPIWAEMNSARLSTESFAERMARMKAEWSEAR